MEYITGECDAAHIRVRGLTKTYGWGAWGTFLVAKTVLISHFRPKRSVSYFLEPRDIQRTNSPRNLITTTATALIQSAPKHN